MNTKLKTISEPLANCFIPTSLDWYKKFQELPRKLSLFEKFQQSQLDQWRNYPDPEPIVIIKNEASVLPLLTLKSFSLWQGMQKSMKTTALALTVAAILKFTHGIDAEDENIQLVGVRHGTVLFFDCEQGVSYAARTMKLILNLAGLTDSPHLIYCDLREYSPKERKAIIAAAIEGTPDTIMVVVDGLVDLMHDFMSAEEGHSVITDLLALCSLHNIHVAGVLHQNKGQSTEARAHVGSIASQKCEMEIMAAKDAVNKGISFISCKVSRGIPFEDFAIEWIGGELPRIVQDGVEGLKLASNPTRNKAISITDFEDIFYLQMLGELFKSDPEPIYSKLWVSIKAFMSSSGKNIGDNRCKEIVSYLIQRGFIKKPDGGIKYYQFNNPV